MLHTIYSAKESLRLKWEALTPRELHATRLQVIMTLPWLQCHAESSSFQYGCWPCTSQVLTLILTFVEKGNKTQRCHWRVLAPRECSTLRRHLCRLEDLFQVVFLAQWEVINDIFTWLPCGHKNKYDCQLLTCHLPLPCSALGNVCENI